MRKTFIMLFSVFVGFLPVSAETWGDFIERVKIMEYNYREGINSGNQYSWSEDKWAALIASSYWLEDSYEDIYRNYFDLSPEQRQIYKRLWDRHKDQSYYIMELFVQTFGFNTAIKNRVFTKAEYWEKHLQNGGTVRMK